MLLLPKLSIFQLVAILFIQLICDTIASAVYVLVDVFVVVEVVVDGVSLCIEACSCAFSLVSFWAVYLLKHLGIQERFSEPSLTPLVLSPVTINLSWTSKCGGGVV